MMCLELENAASYVTRRRQQTNSVCVCVCGLGCHTSQTNLTLAISKSIQPKVQELFGDHNNTTAVTVEEEEQLPCNGSHNNSRQTAVPGRYSPAQPASKHTDILIGKTHKHGHHKAF